MTESRPAKPGPPQQQSPLWRQAFDKTERAVTPRAEEFVRTDTFMTGAALVGRAQSMVRGAARDLTARAWHLLNLPAGSDVSRLRAQIGALDREVRRLTVQLETERRRPPGPARDRTTTEASNADGAQPAEGSRPRPAGRRTQRPPGA